MLMELQLPGNLQGSVFTALLVRMLNPKVFEDLRTKQQLGYIVQLSNMEGRRFQKLRLLVQTEFEAPEVRARIERCWKRQLQWVLEEMDEAEFQHQKQGLGSLLAEAPKNLNEEFNRFWVEVTRRRYDFQRRQKKLELLRAAELQAFRDFVAQLDAAPRIGSHGNLHALLGKGFPELREYCVACAFPKGLAHTEDSQNSEDTNEPIWHQSTCFLEPCELLS